MVCSPGLSYDPDSEADLLLVSGFAERRLTVGDQERCSILRDARC